MLMIFRRGYWDLPKGKLDLGENLEQCALREVEEETGIDGLSILRPVTFNGLSQECTFHIYREKGSWVLKSSYWFLMETSSTSEVVPQVEEDIEKVQWTEPTLLSDLSPIYASIREVLDAVFKTTSI